jgi:outer membrane receptor protein involved in Fe transport
MNPSLLTYCQKSLALVAFLLLGAFTFAQTTINGSVNLDSNTPAIGANVRVKGGTTGTVTDINGKFSIQVPDAAVLIVSYIGMLDQEINTRGQSEINITLEQDAASISEVVVTGSYNATKKLVSPSTVEILTSKQLQAAKPESFNEAVQNIPGVFANTSQGRRGGVVIRGFPDGSPTGGLIYTGILLDGIPTLATPGKLPENGFGFDGNIERIEVVKGSAATLYGRAAAAGVINMITKTGGEKLGGSVRVTNYNDILDKGGFNYRLDYNLNGPITKNLRFNIGGWLLDDSGYRNTGYNDHGGQVRANLDYLLNNNKGNIRVYGMYTDFNFQNLTDVALDASTLKLAAGWKSTDTYNAPTSDQINFRITGRNAANQTNQNVPGPDGQPIIRNFGKALDEGSYAKGAHYGAKFNFNLGGGFSIENHLRAQKMDSGVKYSFALNSYYAATNVARLLLDGDATDTDLINELRIKKNFTGGNSSHTLTAGMYYSTINLLPTTYSYLYGSTSTPNDLKFRNAFAPTAPAPTTGSITRRGDYDETVTAFFLGDEAKLGEKFNLLLAVRYDMLTLDMAETKVPFDTRLTRKEDFADWSATIGANYQLSASSAIYGNINRAFRMPDYSAFTSLEPGTGGKFLRAPDGINENEIINNMEMGYRNSFKGFGIDAAVFYTNIDNRLASIFEDGILVSKPLGSNRIVGGEATLSFSPSFLRGLLLRSSLTVQNPTFTDFKISVSKSAAGAPLVNPQGNLYGNTLIKVSENNYLIDLKGKQLPGVPDLIWNLALNYEHKYFGLDFSYNGNYGRYQDATNILELGALEILNAGAYLKVPIKNGGSNLRLGAQGRNLLNSEGVQGIAGTSDNDTILRTKQSNPTFANLLAHGYLQLPRRLMFYLSFQF